MYAETKRMSRTGHDGSRLLWSVTLRLVGSSLAPQPSGHVEHKASLVSADSRIEHPKGGPARPKGDRGISPAYISTLCGQKRVELTTDSSGH